MSIFGFGYNEHNDDYKVLYAYYSNKGDENVVLVYSFKYESWKRSDRGSSSGLTTETAKAIALPNYKHEATICISASRRLLFAGFHLKREMEVWVMNVYGIEESWIKLVCISNLPVHHPLTRGLDNTAYMAMCNAKLSIAHVYENGDILMMVGHQLKLHRPNDKRENKQSSFRKFITYDRSVSIPGGDFEFLGSCNGLFCFRAKPHQIIIWNPSSNGNLKTIPDVWQLGYLRIFGFGYDERHDDYKVVYAYNAHNGDEYVVLVYSFKHGTWKRIEREFSSGFVNPIVAVFVSGCLNWCNNNLAGSFHHKSQMEVWMMNEYGVEESWTKRVCISSLPLHHPLPRGFENTAYMAICNARIAIAHVSESGDILMKVGRQLKLHRPNAKRGKNFNITYALGYMVTSYVETLVSPAMIGL
nr:F-box/kelch-repeat protein At3g23880-like [Ipomoea batatas]